MYCSFKLAKFGASAARRTALIVIHETITIYLLTYREAGEPKRVENPTQAKKEKRRQFTVDSLSRN